MELILLNTIKFIYLVTSIPIHHNNFHQIFLFSTNLYLVVFYNLKYIKVSLLLLGKCIKQLFILFHLAYDHVLANFKMGQNPVLLINQACFFDLFFSWFSASQICLTFLNPTFIKDFFYIDEDNRLL